MDPLKTPCPLPHRTLEVPGFDPISKCPWCEAPLEDKTPIVSATGWE